MNPDLVAQMSVFFQNPHISTEYLNSIAYHLESKMKNNPPESELLINAMSRLKKLVNEFGDKDPAHNGILRKLCLTMAQTYVIKASKEDISETQDFIKSLMTLV